MRQNINFLLASAIFLIILFTMNSNAIPIFVVSGIVTNPNGVLVNGLEVTVENQTRNIIGQSVTGETGDGRYDVVFLSFNGGSVGEIGDILNIIIEMNGETIAEVIHILNVQNIDDTHLNLNIQLQVDIPISMLPVKPETNKTDTLGRLKYKPEIPCSQYLSHPKKTRLFQNYPNPFNPETWIPYQLSQDSTVIISIYKTTGQLIRRLSLGHKSAGIYTSKKLAAHWDGRDNYGMEVASGIYFYTIQAGNFNATRKMVILK